MDSPANIQCRQSKFLKQTLGCGYGCLGCWLLFLCVVFLFSIRFKVCQANHFVIGFPVSTKIISYLLVSCGRSIASIIREMYQEYV